MNKFGIIYVSSLVANNQYTMTHTFLYAAGISLVVLSACQGGQKPTTETQQDSIASTSPPVENEDSYYAAALPAASSPGRTIELSVKANGDAEMVTDYNNFSPEIVQMGSWVQQPEDRILLSLVTVGSGISKKDTLVFKKEGTTLVYEGTDMGTAGLKLTKAEKPAPKEKELTMWVNKKKGTCNTGAGAPQECYLIAYGKTAPTKESEWENFSSEITGFDYKPGKIYQLKVLRKPRQHPPQDVSMYTYELKEVISAK